MKKIYVGLSLLAALSSCGQNHFSAKPSTAKQTTLLESSSTFAPLCLFSPSQIDKVESRPVFVERTTNWIFFRGKLAIDVDGSPRAYGPNNTGLDYTANAGHPGDWWGVAVDPATKDPYIQKATDPYPGMYISTTALVDKTYKSESNPKRFVDAEKIPYIGLPNKKYKQWGIRIGDIALVYNLKNGKRAFATFADIKNPNTLGEGSVFLAAQLGLNADPRRGGTSGADIAYIVFPKSGLGQGKIPTPSDIDNLAGRFLGDSCGYFSDLMISMLSSMPPKPKKG